MRRLILSKDALIWTHLGVDIALDKIPLHEILSISRSGEPKKGISERLIFNDVVCANDADLVKSRSMSSGFGENVLVISTPIDGFNAGKLLCFRLADTGRLPEWDLKLSSAIIDAKKRQHRKHMIDSWQVFLRRNFERTPVRMFCAFLIFINFAIDAAECQLQPEKGSWLSSFFYSFEVFFTIIFMVELCWNTLKGKFFRELLP